MDIASLFVKGKGPILVEYLRTRKKLGDAVAGRGFSFEPGLMYDAQNDLEIDLKGQLSALNYQLLEQAITQELKQSGLDYDLAFKNAMIAWESDKQALISDLDREISMAKQAMAGDDELIRILAIEVSRRSAALETAKLAIELEAESIRKQIEELGSSTADYEVQLADAKVITARKKLEVIPYIEQLIDIERDMIDKEYQLMAKSQEMAVKSQALLEKEYDVLDKDQQILVKETEISGKVQEITAKETEIVAKNQEIVIIAQDIATKMGEIIAKDTEIIGKNQELITKQEAILAIVEQIVDVESDIIDKRRDIINKQEQIKTRVETILSKELIIVDIESDVIDKQDSILTGSGVLVDASERLVDARESELIPAQEELIAAERTAVELRESLVRPALEALLVVMEEYVSELAVQLELYNDITASKAETIEVKEEIVAIQAEILDRKRSLSDVTNVLIDLTEEVISYKIEYLGSALSELISVLTEYGGVSTAGGGSVLGGGGSSVGELEQQILLKSQIADIRKEIVLLVTDKVAGELDVDAAEVLYEQQKNLLVAAELSIKSLQAQNELLRAQQAETDLVNYAGQWSETESGIVTEKENTINTVIALATDEQVQKQNTRINSQTTVSDAQLFAIEREGDADKDKVINLAQIEIDSKDVTAQLVHLLKQD